MPADRDVSTEGPQADPKPTDAVLGDDGATDAPALTAYHYPVSPFMDDCAYGTDYPSSYGTGASFFLFETREDCCEKWECPATTVPATTAAATTEAAITTAAAATEGPDKVEDDAAGTVYHPCAVGPDAEPCLKGEVCAVSDAETCAGICLPAPQAVCPYTYQPVCGCGEVEYSNACMAGLDGNAVKHWGKCGGPVLDGSGVGDDAPATTGAPVTEAPVTTDAPATTTGLPLPAMYHPDLSAHDSGRVPCVYSNDYPEWYLDAENYQSHLFATEAECCAVHNCLSNYPDMWYPTIVMGDGDGDGVNDEDEIVCVYENMYPTDWLGEEGYLFKTEADCYARHGEDPAGREFWYPELVGGLKSCVYGSSYLPGWYVNPATRADWLFASQGECCDFHSCDDDPDSSAEDRAEHWHPDFDSYEHGAGDKIRCASSSAYPDFFAMDGIEPKHLFDDEESCCAVWDCGLDLERFWYPDLNEEEATGVATCLYGNAYPLPFLADLENHLFADEGSCLTRGDATAAPSYYYPAVVDGVRECPYGSDYDPAYSSFPGLLFDDHASCCEAHSACPGLRSGADEVWWPDLAGFVTTGRIDCVFSGEYPEYYTEIPEGHLYDDRESCCGDHPCPTNFADKWYPVVGTSMTCQNDNSYPLEHLASSAMYLFATESACLALWGGADVPDAPTTTAAPLLGDGTPATMPLPGDDAPATTDAPAIGANPDDSPGEEEPEEMMWFPDITGEGNSCAHGVPEAGMFVVSQGFVYGTEAECCEAHSCDDFVDDPTTTAAATVAATTTEAATAEPSPAPTPPPTLPPVEPVARFWPGFVGGVATCSPSDARPSYYFDAADGFESFETKDECCQSYPCLDGPIYPASKPPLAYSGALDGQDHCRFDADYPLFYTSSQQSFYTLLFVSTRVCCESMGYACTSSPTPAPTGEPTPSPTPSPTEEPTPAPIAPTAAPSGEPTATSFWYADIQASGDVCVYGTGYEGWMADPTFSAAQLFDGKDDCCATHFPVSGCDDGAVPSGGAVPADTVTYIEEDFEGGMGTLPWVHGGTTTHVADWDVSTHDSRPPAGFHSLRSGDLNSTPSKSSDISLQVDSSRGGFLEFYYKADVSWPYDRLVVRLNGAEKFARTSVTRSNGRDPWVKFLMAVPGDVVRVTVSVESYPASEGGDYGARDPERDGTGFVYIDDLTFTAFNWR